MLESLEANNRDPRRRELYVRHCQVYSLLELNMRLSRMRKVGSVSVEIERAISDLSALIAEQVTRFEEAAVPDRKPVFYSDNQISKLENASSCLKNLCDEDAPISSLMQAARHVVAAGSVRRFGPLQLVVSNA